MEIVVEFALVHELWVFSVGGFELDGNLQVGLGIDALEDLSKCSLIQFSDNLVISPYFLRNLRHTTFY